MGKLIDLTGQRFGRLTVIERAPNRKKSTMWKCACECGNVTTVCGEDIKNGKSLSCGCLKREKSLSRAFDLTGKRFGRLEVISRAPNRGPRAFWNCRCDCGRESVVATWQLTSGKTNSCGCLRSDTHPSTEFKALDWSGKRVGSLTVIERVQNRGNRVFWLCQCDCGQFYEVASDSLANGPAQRCVCTKKAPLHTERLHHVWAGMKARCSIESATGYQYYGKRGIKVCGDWANSYETFKKWAYANGYDENAPYGQCTIDRIDPNGDYCPENCRWVDNVIQANNKTNNVFMTFGNVTHTRKEWSNILGVSTEQIRSKTRRGLSDEETIRMFGGSAGERLGDKIQG